MRLAYFLWSFVERFGTSLLSFGGNILLSYLVSPHDFGIVASLGIFTSLIFVFVDCGLSDGLLRQKEVTDREVNTLLVFNVSVGIAVFVLYAALAPFVASWLRMPEITSVMPALGLGAIFSGLSIAQATRLRSELRFRHMAIINLIAITSALLLAVAVALMGLRYWALVAMQIGFAAFYFLALLVSSKWNFKLEFDKEAFSRLWKFGSNLLVSTLVTQLSQNIFAFLLGKYYSPTQAGYMGQAQKLQQTPTNSIEMTISGTSFVAIAKNESDEMKKSEFERMFGVMTYVNTLFCCLFLAISAPVIEVVFSDKWLPVIPYLRVMLVWGLVYPVCSFMMILFKTFNLTSVIRNVLIIEKVLIVLVAILLVSRGVIVMVSSAASLSLLSLVLYCYFAERHTGIRLKSLLRTYGSNLLLGALALIPAWAVTTLCGGLTTLLLSAAVFLLIAAAVCRLARPDYWNYATKFRKAEY